MAVDLINRQLASGAVHVIEIDTELLNEGLDLYRRRPDQRYSLTDCISMVIARAMSITEILTTDRDFQTEGFTILLPE
jgi:predicted nucleic acid-binding protein